jgi:hypothetical protein
LKAGQSKLIVLVFHLVKFLRVKVEPTLSGALHSMAQLLALLYRARTLIEIFPNFWKKVAKSAQISAMSNVA